MNNIFTENYKNVMINHIRDDRVCITVLIIFYKNNKTKKDETYGR